MLECAFRNPQLSANVGHKTVINEQLWLVFLDIKI